jgi:type II secretory pathway pseudopilin PulG
MAALLIAISVMAILMTAVMPAWKQDAQREKEAELVFRGQQYVHAVQLYQRKAGPGAYPPSFDFMVQQKFLRKRYKDPITNSDFLPLAGLAQGSVPGAPAGGAAGSTTSGPTNGASTTGVAIALTSTDGSAPGGVAGVMSKSTDKSIRIYNGQTHYNEWVFRALAPTPQNGAGGGAAGGPQRGAPNGQNPQGGGFNGGPGRGPQRGGPNGRGGPPNGFGPPGGANGPPPNGNGRGFQTFQPPAGPATGR